MRITYKYFLKNFISFLLNPAVTCHFLSNGSTSLRSQVRIPLRVKKFDPLDLLICKTILYHEYTVVREALLLVFFWLVSYLRLSQCMYETDEGLL